MLPNEDLDFQHIFGPIDTGVCRHRYRQGYRYGVQVFDNDAFASTHQYKNFFISIDTSGINDDF